MDVLALLSGFKLCLLKSTALPSEGGITSQALKVEGHPA